jgi:hypothetical protein
LRTCRGQNNEVFVNTNEQCHVIGSGTCGQGGAPPKYMLREHCPTHPPKFLLIYDFTMDNITKNVEKCPQNCNICTCFYEFFEVKTTLIVILYEKV